MNLRHKNEQWLFPSTDKGTIDKWEYVSIAVLMDIRDELQRLNQLLHCTNFVQLPGVVRTINRKLPDRVRQARARRKRAKTA